MIVAMGALHKAYGLKELVVSSYQAASGAGQSGIDALREQIKQVAGTDAGSVAGDVHAVVKDFGPFPSPLALNVVPWAGSLKGWAEYFPYSTIFSLPRTVKASGLGKSQKRDVQIPLLDAVVGNPPYIRQEDIPKHLKDNYQQITKQNNVKLSARSDIHCYFWVHSISFLKENGYLCFLTSSQWLDTDYGFKLQDFILQNFEIIAILESFDEPWFIGARVATVVTILRRQTNEEKRMQNIVRFVQLRQPIAEILANDGTTAGAIQAADRFRDELLGLTENTRNSRYRSRLIKQEDLWNEGVSFSLSIKNTQEENLDEDFTDIDEELFVQPTKYYGSKWGIHLRAPDLWFDFLEKFGKSLVPLSKVVNIRRGITSGKDVFFFPIDWTKEALKIQDKSSFRERFGVDIEEVINGNIKIVKCGEKYEELKAIESRYVEPEVHSLMNINGYSIRENHCARLVFLAPSNRSLLQNTCALNYIEWGEEQGFDQTPTCKGRATEEREWFDLTNNPRMGVILPKIQQYRLFTLLNESLYHQASALLGIVNSQTISHNLIAGVMNSTICILSRLLYARVLGNEGNIQLDVYSANMMLVPDPRLANHNQAQKIEQAFSKMCNRSVLSFVSERRLRTMNYTDTGREHELNLLSNETELTQSDRRELDDTVLKMLGVSSAKERKQILDELYSYLADFFEWTRQKEEKAIQNKNRSNRRRGIKPSDIAREIFGEIEENNGMFLRTYDDFLDHSQPFNTYEVPEEGIPERLDNLFEQHAIEFASKTQDPLIVGTRSESQRELLLLIVQQGIRGFVRIPLDDNYCQELHNEYSNFLQQRADTLQIIVEERTADSELQNKIYTELLKLIQAASQ
jgi:hypothetical protein